MPKMTDDEIDNAVDGVMGLRDPTCIKINPEPNSMRATIDCKRADIADKNELKDPWE